MGLEKKDLEKFRNNGFVFLRRKSGFHYKCKIAEITDTCIVILDKFNAQIVFPLDDVLDVHTWIEKSDKQEEVQQQ